MITLLSAEAQYCYLARTSNAYKPEESGSSVNF